MKAITFKQFLLTYNFRNYRDDCKIENNRCDTNIIRIEYYRNKDSYDPTWFELGLYDFGPNCDKLKNINKVLSKDILNMNVSSFYFDYDLNTFVVTLTTDAHIEGVNGV